MPFYDDKEERENEDLQAQKVGEYDNPDNGCPNCGRYRVMIGEDKNHRCEKCCWCIETDDYDHKFLSYMR